ncbi:MAG: CorA family divalent cation transporter [Bdellovibrionales bacterium]
MTETRIDFHGFHWLDIGNPTPERLNALAETYDLHPTSVQDCLQPEHLPKYEMINDVGFVVLRAYDPECTREADTVQELTRKIAVFYADRFVITIHRKDLPFIFDRLARWKDPKLNQDPAVTAENILADLLNEVVRSYDRPVMDCVANLEIFEMEIFGARTQRKFRIQNGYYLKRKASVFKRMLRATIEPVNRIMGNAEEYLHPHFRNVKDQIDSIYFYADEISESISSLLNLHISLASQKTNEASHRTNEVMRVLTIFSCFFLPTNFIASIYGMNFAYMPETQWHYGFYFALGLMAAVAVGILFWFRKRGWLRRRARRVSRK